MTPQRFDVRLQSPSAGSAVVDKVSYLVAQEGVWTINGVDVEAQTYTSSVTDAKASWVGEPQAYGRAYLEPSSVRGS